LEVAEAKKYARAGLEALITKIFEEALKPAFEKLAKEASTSTLSTTVAQKLSDRTEKLKYVGSMGAAHVDPDMQDGSRWLFIRV